MESRGIRRPRLPTTPPAEELLQLPRIAKLAGGDAIMAKQFTERSTRKFDPMAVPGLSSEARDAVNAAFHAMSTWRTETVQNSEKNFEQVIEKMAAAAQALGWPEQIVDATRSQMQTVTKTQIQMMDQMMDAWEEQIKSPNPSAMLSKLKSLSRRGVGQISVVICPR
jgi:hypothetical protein